ERFRDGPDNLITRIFKGMGVALLGGEGTELAGEYTDVGIVDVPVVDIAGVVSIFSLTHHIGDDPERVEIVRAIQIESIGLRNSLARLNFFSDWPKFFGNKQVIHSQARAKASGNQECTDRFQLATKTMATKFVKEQISATCQILSKFRSMHSLSDRCPAKIEEQWEDRMRMLKTCGSWNW